MSLCTVAAFGGMGYVKKLEIGGGVTVVVVPSLGSLTWIVEGPVIYLVDRGSDDANAEKAVQLLSKPEDSQRGTAGGGD